MAKSSEKKKNFVHTIEMRNETEFSDVYECHKNAIYDHIMYSMESFKFDIDLLVIFQNFDDIKNLINQETGNAATTLKENKYTVIFNIDSLRKIDYDGGLDIAISVRHELAHVYDLYCTMHNKSYKINPLKVKHKKFDDFVITIGWRFWTEFFAYFMTYRKFKYEYGYPTFLQLVKGYEKLQNRCKEIELMLDSESKDTERALIDFNDEIDNFAYVVAKYIAGSSGGKPYLYEYCEKTKNRASFEIMENLMHGLQRKILPLLKNTYGKGMANKMYALGKYVIKNLYDKFNLYPVKHKKYICFAYYY